MTGKVWVLTWCSCEAFTSCHWLYHLHISLRPGWFDRVCFRTLSGCLLNLSDWPSDPLSLPFLLLEPRGWCPELSPSTSNQWCHQPLPAIIPVRPECPYPCPVCAIHLRSVILWSWFSASTVSRTVWSCGELKAEGKASSVVGDEERGDFEARQTGAGGGASCLHIIHYVIFMSGAVISSLIKWGWEYTFREPWKD